MIFVPVGIGDAFSSRYYSSALFIEHDGYRILMDCPHPLRKILREGSLSSGIPMDVGNIDAVVVTHLHADHANGLEGLAFYSHYVTKRKITLCTHLDSMNVIWSQHLAPNLAPLCDPPDRQRRLTDYFTPVTMTEHEPVQLGPFTIECKKTHHHVPTTALRFTAGDTSLACSADTSFDPTLIEWMAKCDMMVHETNHGPHTPYDKLAALPESILKKMRLIHYPDNFDKQRSVIEPLEQGRKYLVPTK